MPPARGAHGAGGTPWGWGWGRDPGATSLQRAAGGCGLQEGGGAATSFLGCPRDRANGHPAGLGYTGSTGQASTPGCGVTWGWHSRVTRGAVCEPLRCPLAPNQHHQYHTSACTSATSPTSTGWEQQQGGRVPINPEPGLPRADPSRFYLRLRFLCMNKNEPSLLLPSTAPTADAAVEF